MPPSPRARFSRDRREYACCPHAPFLSVSYPSQKRSGCPLSYTVIFPNTTLGILLTAFIYSGPEAELEFLY